MVPFGPFLPDIATFNSLAATEAQGVIPSPTGYRPFPAFNANTSAITARAQGAVSVRDNSSGTIHNFCGDATKLYKMASDGLSWNDVSRLAGGVYATATDGWWEFSQFGNVVMADNGTDAAQAFTVGSSSNFAALGGSSPIASFGFAIRGFAVKCKVAGAFNRVHWSAIEDVTSWVASATTLSDAQDLPDGGIIMGAVGGEYGVIFQERAIQRMAFEGPPTAFRFDKIVNTLGVRCARSIAAYDNIAFFLAHDGFYMLRGGVELVPIGDEKVNRWFHDNFDSTYPYRVSSAIDPINGLYVIGFPTSSAVSGSPDALLIYHWRTGQWSRIAVNHEIVYPAATQSSATIDGLDSYSATIDGLLFPVDSAIYTGTGRLLLAGFNTSHQQGFYSGTNVAATIETGEAQLVAGRKSLLRGLRPIVEGTSVTPSATIRWRNRMQDALTDETAVAANSTGICKVRAKARYHRAKITIPAASTWTYARGIDDLEITAMGKR